MFEMGRMKYNNIMFNMKNNLNGVLYKSSFCQGGYYKHNYSENVEPILLFIDSLLDCVALEVMWLF